MNTPDELLNAALKAEGGVGRLADSLGVRQNVVSNWRRRGLPHPWRLVLQLRYDGAVSAAKAGPQPQA